MDVDIFSIVNFVARLITILAVVGYIIPKAFKEALEPKDKYSRLRWQLLALCVSVATAILPSLIYQGIRSLGLESDMLRSVASLSISLSLMCFSLVFVLIYNYRLKK